MTRSEFNDYFAANWPRTDADTCVWPVLREVVVEVSAQYISDRGLMSCIKRRVRGNIRVAADMAIEGGVDPDALFAPFVLLTSHLEKRLV